VQVIDDHPQVEAKLRPILFDLRRPAWQQHEAGAPLGTSSSSACVASSSSGSGAAIAAKWRRQQMVRSIMPPAHPLQRFASHGHHFLDVDVEPVERRRALGLTQEQAGRLVGMHRLAYHRVESGERQIKFAELGHICAAFGCQIGDLVQDSQLAEAYVSVARAILGDHPTGGSRVEIDHRAREARRRQERLAAEIIELTNS
jgi:transcriptional regulator with XRE-family HTH domain